MTGMSRPELKACCIATNLNRGCTVLKGMAEMPSDDGTFLSYRHAVSNGMPMAAKPSLLTGYFFFHPILENEEFSPMLVDSDDTDIFQ